MNTLPHHCPHPHQIAITAAVGSISLATLNPHLMEISDGHILTAAGGVFAAIGTAMKIMWDSLKKGHDRLEERADDCEKDRDEMHDQIAELKEKVGGYNKCPLPACPFGVRRGEIITPPE